MPGTLERLSQAERVYTEYSITNAGLVMSAKGTVSGQTWTWNGEAKAGSHLMRVRLTTREESPTAYVFRMEGSFAGSPWMVLEEAKGTKAP